MVETGLTKQEIVVQLARSPHGKLAEYLPVGQRAAREEAEFFAHLIAYNQIHGQIRDAKVALPVVSLSVSQFNDPELVENSLAHLALLDPRNFVRAYRFAREAQIPRRMRLRKLTEKYLRKIERKFQARTIMQHRSALKELYGLNHTKASEYMQIALHHRALDKTAAAPPVGSAFWAVSTLKDASPAEAAGLILKYKIPFLIASGSLGSKIKDPELAVALIDQMSATEFTTNQKLLQKLGVQTNPAVRAAYEQSLQRAAKSKQNTLKATTALENIEDEGIKEKLRGLQEKQIQQTGGIEGNWLVLGDRSGSMAHAIETARLVASTLTALVRGKVYLIFFDDMPTYYEVSGLTYDQIKEKTKRVTVGGSTSIGCGLQYAIDAKLDLDGIAIISDGEENHTPFFRDSYARYKALFDKEPPVYLYLTEGGNSAGFLLEAKKAGVDIQVFDLRGQKVDAYSLPNLAQTMRASRYSLVDSILGTPLLTLDEVFTDGTATSTA